MDNKKPLLTFQVFCAIFGIALILSKDLVAFGLAKVFYLNEGIAIFAVTTVGLMTVVLGMAPIISRYLSNPSFSSEASEILKEVVKKMAALENRQEHVKVGEINEEELNALMSKKISEITNEKALEIIEQTYGQNIFEKYKLQFITDELNAIKIRLLKETERIARISNVNLILGFATTVIAIGYLGFSLTSSDDFTKILITEIQEKSDYRIVFATFLIKFLPRISISVFIELFSFFFLRIYKTNLEDIKYLNNERTNIELKLLSLNAAVVSKEAVKEVILELSKTERNFILKKDESTVDIEKNKLESNAYKDTLETVSKMFKGK